jgi:hypothetical protein
LTNSHTIGILVIQADEREPDVITETYKGRKIKVAKGREYGYSRVTLNGVSLGDYLGTQEKALASVEGTVDHADEVGLGSGRYGAEWYTSGTYELCRNGHAMPVGGECGHEYCVRRRTV